MIVGVSSLVIIGKLSSPRFFVLHLQQLEGRGVTLRFARTYLVDGFETAWNRSTFWSVIAGATAAGGLSYWVSKRIMQPLTQIEQLLRSLPQGIWRSDCRPVRFLKSINWLPVLTGWRSVWKTWN
jgi:hypothetical protein